MGNKCLMFLVAHSLLCALSLIVYDQLQKSEIARKNDKHWAFLDEMEAPMWADLTVEAEGNHQDIDDGWFNTSHMYHEWHYLEAKVLSDCPGYGCGSSRVNFNRGSSPELPSLVSISRGRRNRSVQSSRDEASMEMEEINAKARIINSGGPWRRKGVVISSDVEENNSKVLSSQGETKGNSSCIEVIDGNTSAITPELSSSKTGFINKSSVIPLNSQRGQPAFSTNEERMTSVRRSKAGDSTSSKNSQ